MNLKKPLFYIASALVLAGCGATSKVAKTPLEKIQTVDVIQSKDIKNPSKEVLDNSEVFVNLPQDVLKLYDDAWIQIKSE